MWKLLCDPAAADKQISVVEDTGLAGRDRSLRNVQFHVRAPIGQGRHGRRCARMIITNLGADLECRGRLIEWNPIATLDSQFAAFKSQFIADDDPVASAIKLDHVKRFAGGDAESFALAEGVEFDA